MIKKEKKENIFIFLSNYPNFQSKTEYQIIDYLKNDGSGIVKTSYKIEDVDFSFKLFDLLNEFVENDKTKKHRLSDFKNLLNNIFGYLNTVNKEKIRDNTGNNNFKEKDEYLKKIHEYKAKIEEAIDKKPLNISAVNYQDCCNNFLGSDHAPILQRFENNGKEYALISWNVQKKMEKPASVDYFNNPFNKTENDVEFENRKKIQKQYLLDLKAKLEKEGREIVLSLQEDDYFYKDKDFLKEFNVSTFQDKQEVRNFATKSIKFDSKDDVNLKDILNISNSDKLKKINQKREAYCPVVNKKSVSKMDNFYLLNLHGTFESNDYSNYVKEVIEYCKTKNLQVIICGDFNVDLTQEYFDDKKQVKNPFSKKEREEYFQTKLCNVSKTNSQENTKDNIPSGHVLTNYDFSFANFKTELSYNSFKEEGGKIVYENKLNKNIEKDDKNKKPIFTDNKKPLNTVEFQNPKELKTLKSKISKEKVKELIKDGVYINKMNQLATKNAAFLTNKEHFDWYIIPCNTKNKLYLNDLNIEENDGDFYKTLIEEKRKEYKQILENIISELDSGTNIDSLRGRKVLQFYYRAAKHNSEFLKENIQLYKILLQKVKEVDYFKNDPEEYYKEDVKELIEVYNKEIGKTEIREIIRNANVVDYERSYENKDLNDCKINSKFKEGDEKEKRKNNQNNNNKPAIIKYNAPVAFMKAWWNNFKNINIPAIAGSSFENGKYKNNGGFFKGDSLEKLVQRCDDFKLNNFRKLGFNSELEYQSFLKKRYDEAFMPIHFAECEPLFIKERNKQNQNETDFNLCEDGLKNYVISVAGVEVRNNRKIFNGFTKKEEFLYFLEKNAKENMQNILQVAREQNIEAICMPDVGCGVFLEELEDVSVEEMANAIKKGFFAAILNNKEIEKPYIISNFLKDNTSYKIVNSKKDLISLSIDLNKKRIKTAFINAGDHDWMINQNASLPGECWLGHSYRGSKTTDETFALMHKDFTTSLFLNKNCKIESNYNKDKILNNDEKSKIKERKIFQNININNQKKLTIVDVSNQIKSINSNLISIKDNKFWISKDAELNKKRANIWQKLKNENKTSQNVKFYSSKKTPLEQLFKLRYNQELNEKYNHNSGIYNYAEPLVLLQANEKGEAEFVKEPKDILPVISFAAPDFNRDKEAKKLLNDNKGFKTIEEIAGFNILNSLIVAADNGVEVLCLPPVGLGDYLGRYKPEDIAKYTVSGFNQGIKQFNEKRIKDGKNPIYVVFQENRNIRAWDFSNNDFCLKTNDKDFRFLSKELTTKGIKTAMLNGANAEWLVHSIGLMGQSVPGNNYQDLSRGGVNNLTDEGIASKTNFPDSIFQNSFEICKIDSSAMNVVERKELKTGANKLINKPLEIQDAYDEASVYNEKGKKLKIIEIPEDKVFSDKRGEIIIKDDGEIIRKEKDFSKKENLNKESHFKRENFKHKSNSSVEKREDDLSIDDSHHSYKESSAEYENLSDIDEVKKGKREIEDVFYKKEQKNKKHIVIDEPAIRNLNNIKIEPLKTNSLDKKEDNTLLIVSVLIVAILCIIGGGLYFANSKQNDNNLMNNPSSANANLNNLNTSNVVSV